MEHDIIVQNTLKETKRRRRKRKVSSLYFHFPVEVKLFAQRPRMTAARSKNMNRKISNL